MLHISLKTEKSFIAHPWRLLCVVGLEEYSARDWRAATSGTARSSYLARVGPVAWRTLHTVFIGLQMKQIKCMLLISHEIHCNYYSLRWRHNEHDDVSNHLRLYCLLNRLFRCRSKKTPKLRVAGLCEGNSPMTGEFPTQRASNAENVSISWRHHVLTIGEYRHLSICLSVFREVSLSIRLFSFQNIDKISLSVSSSLFIFYDLHQFLKVPTHYKRRR